MTGWTKNRDIKTRLEKKWAKGIFLAQSVSPEPFAPLCIPLKRPTAKELTHKFEAARTWVAHLVHHAARENQKGFTLEWQEINHRSLGRNRIPKAVVFNTLDDLGSYLDKNAEIRLYQSLFTQITARFPELDALLTEKPLEVPAHDRVWNQLLAVAAWVRAHPRPGIYLRQLEIPGVDTKFIETHKAWLTRLLKAVLPPEGVKDDVKGKSAFELRFGFRPKPSRIRFRVLDPSLAVTGLTDLEIPVDDFCRLPVSPKIVFIVENEITGLSFPSFSKALVIIGLGYGLSLLSGALWMKDLPLWYWGDLDTHGFAMLDQIRGLFPQSRSFLMDETTLLSHRPLWGKEPSPSSRDLPRLTSKEAKVYEALRNNDHAHHLRLEQERISFNLVHQTVDKIKRHGSRVNSEAGDLTGL